MFSNRHCDVSLLLHSQNPSTSTAHAVVRAEDFDDSFGNGEGDDSLDELVGVLLLIFLRLNSTHRLQLLATSGKQPTEHPPKQIQTATVCIDDFDDDDFDVEPIPVRRA